jgi:hypothetical protein
MKKLHFPEEPSPRRSPTIFLLCLLIALVITVAHCIRVLAGERVLPAP